MASLIGSFLCALAGSDNAATIKNTDTAVRRLPWFIAVLLSVFISGSVSWQARCHVGSEQQPSAQAECHSAYGLAILYHFSIAENRSARKGAKSMLGSRPAIASARALPDAAAVVRPS